MKTIFMGSVIFIFWAVFSNYWYVNKIWNYRTATVKTSTPPEGVFIPEETDDFTKEVENLSVHFAFDSMHGLYPEELENVLEDITRQNPVNLIIVGHTCDMGSESYNYNLGNKRAEWLKNELISKGFDSGKISIVTYGETRPVSPNTTEENRMKNRRAEIILNIK